MAGNPGCRSEQPKYLSSFEAQRRQEGCDKVEEKNTVKRLTEHGMNEGGKKWKRKEGAAVVLNNCHSAKGLTVRAEGCGELQQPQKHSVHID